MEEWKTISGWPKYKVSSKGDVIGQRNKRLKPAINNWGYKTVVLCNNTYRKTVKIHRLVAEAFIPNPENKPTVNHINGNKLDNNVDNLEWATVKEQQNHRTHVLGFGTKLANNANKKPVLCVETKERFSSIKEAANAYNGDRTRLSMAIKNNKMWHHFHWVFISNKEKLWH